MSEQLLGLERSIARMRKHRNRVFAANNFDDWKVAQVVFIDEMLSEMEADYARSVISKGEWRVASKSDVALSKAEALLREVCAFLDDEIIRGDPEEGDRPGSMHAKSRDLTKRIAELLNGGAP
jgi:hypothetical protein